MVRTPFSNTYLRAALLCLVIPVILLIAGVAHAQTYGIEDEQGNFVPKVTVSVGEKVITVKKYNEREKFKSIAFKVNKDNPRLVRNVGLLNIQWINYRNEPGRPLPFAGPRYDARERAFRDSMTKSLAVRIIDKSTADLFVGKDFSDLFTLFINGKRAISSESFYEEEPVQLDTGRDLSVDVDRTSITFSSDNYKKGEFINVENRSKSEQVLGVEPPKTGLLYFQMVRTPEQMKVPPGEWNRFTVGPDAGFFMVLIPDDDPTRLAELDGKAIEIKVWQGGQVGENRRIPIEVSADLIQMLRTRHQSSPTDAFGPPLEEDIPEQVESTEPPAEPASEPFPEEASEPPKEKPEPTPAAPGKEAPGQSIWMWVLVVAALVIGASLAIYCLFFMLPRIQVLEDRLTKNEMFLHGSREAIREELEEIKEDILSQCQKDPGANNE